MKKAPFVALAAFLTVIFASCATTLYVQREAGVMRLIRLINEGKVNEKQGLSPTPFLLDGETLYLESDVSTMWANLKEASFAMTDAKFVETRPVDENSYKAFADTFDMKNYFAKYTGPDSSVVTVDTAEGRYYLLLERAKMGVPRIRGLKGPVK